MDRHTLLRVILPVVVILTVIISFLILTGLASSNPDGFEWSLFHWAGIAEPEGGFAGILAFLGESPAADIVAGGTGIVVILIIAYLFFKLTARKTK